MIDFHTPTLSDRDWIVQRAFESGNRGSEFSFGSLVLWAPAYGQQVADWNGLMLVRARVEEGPGYFWPAGAGDPETGLAALEDDARQRGERLLLVCLSPEQAARLEELRPGQFSFTSHRNGWDYLYSVDKLSSLVGRKLHAKRNHCKRFGENHPDWSFQPMTPEDLPECLELDAQWDRLSREREGLAEAQDMSNERRALRTAAEHFQALGLEGGVLRAEGRMVAFTMGDPICEDTFDVHFEKAYGDIQGAYAMINREFARLIQARHPQVKYLNREEDMGLEGLRKAKESYYPDLMVEKYWAVRK